MKKITLLIVLALIFTFNAEAKKIKGRIILENDTLEVTFKIDVSVLTQAPDFVGMQYKITYYDESGNKKILLPESAKEIQFTHETVNVRMLSRLNTLGLGNKLSPQSHVFLRLRIDGPLKLFDYYFDASTPANGLSYNADQHILQKEGRPLMRPRAISFKKDLTEYFSDCPEMVQKIENKDFHISRDMFLMVKFYNSNCANKGVVSSE